MTDLIIRIIINALIFVPAMYFAIVIYSRVQHLLPEKLKPLFDKDRKLPQ